MGFFKKGSQGSVEPLDTESSRLIKQLVCVRDLKSLSYLEIGIEFGATFQNVVAKLKVGVDPEPKMKSPLNKGSKLFVETSDTFFASNKTRFDVIFLDGLHTFEQTWQDLKNAMQVCNPGGLIILDDTVPCDEFSGHPNALEAYRLREEAGFANYGAWHGDVYKIILAFSELKLESFRYSTIVDLVNPKTVLWMENDFSWPNLPDVSKVLIHDPGYSDLFGEGVPQDFNPITQADLFALLTQRTTT
jgi:hypothetical protein